MEYEHIVHPFEPVFTPDSEVLVLGSFPSVKSREQSFYYGHPQNRFWKVLCALLNEDFPLTVQDKIHMLNDHKIALWDVIESCDIKGSSDSSIKNAVPTDISSILAETKISRIYCNGKLAGKLYDKYQNKLTGIPAVTLPSTSPANAAFSLEKLTTEWSVIICKH